VSPTDTASRPPRPSSHRGCVAAGHPVTAEAAVAVLRAGGNAFDAALAALYAACVAEPVLASLGGGGFLLARPEGGPARVFDFFVHTPQVRRPPGEVHAYPIVTDWGTAQQEFQIGLGTVAVPGIVRGIFAVHRALGRLPMADIVAPAAAAARDGVVVSPFQSYLMTLVAPIYLGTDETRALYTGGEGDVLHNPGMADLLDGLAREGDRLFYEGAVADAIVGSCARGGGHLTHDDLRRYAAVAREPLTVRYRDATITTNPPPSAGGTLIAFGLALLDRVDLRDLTFGSPEHAALLARVMTRTVDARTAHGSGAHLLAEATLARYAAELVGARAAYRGTTHISVVDAAGNAAAVTVSNGEGCGALVPGTGMMLNNMLGEDDVNPAGVHAWPEGQRLSSMMAPTLLTRDDGAFAVTGSGGSKRIRTAILQVVSNLIDFGMTPEDAVGAPRLHVEPDHLSVEAGFAAETTAVLAGLLPQHTLWNARNMFFGGVHTVARAQGGALTGVGDPRRGGVCLFV
jgi:gamma-glutamyltranspeptidase/glutathione hydrolase